MLSVREIVSVLGGPTALARELGLRPSTVSEMKRRASIPVEYWEDLIDVGRRRGVTDLTVEVLARIHARTTARSPSRKSGSDARPPSGERRENGHFSRFYHLSEPHFPTDRSVDEHVAALRSEWDRA